MNDLYPTIYLTEDKEGGQGQQGKFYDAYSKFLNQKYAEFIGIITLEEMAILEDGLTYYKWEGPTERAERITQWESVMEKIPDNLLEANRDRQLAELQKRARELYIHNKRTRHAGYQLGAREFTLTYSPKWFSDDEARVQMRTAIERICRYYKDGDERIIKLRAVGEVGTNGLSHVHCFYKLLGGVKITDKNFKRAYKPWNPKVKQGPTGHKGGHHANVKHESDFLGYIEKQVNDAWLDVVVEAPE